jgi:hypothetical protein
MKIIEKMKQNIWAILLFFVLVIFLKQCSITREQNKISKDIKSIRTQMDSLTSKKDIIREIKIEGLKTSKRTLYDWNSVIRTTTRPDDRMNEYDQEIEVLEKTK